jgi:hypothetical protein
MLVLGLGRAEAMRVHVVPAHPTPADPLKIVIEGDLEGCTAGFTAPQLVGNEIIMHVRASAKPESPDCTGVWAAAFDFHPLTAGFWDVRIDDGGFLVAVGSFEVVGPDPGTGFRGDLTVSPRLPTTEDRIQILPKLPACAALVQPPNVQGDRILLRITGFDVPCPQPVPTPAPIFVGPLPAGSYTVLYVFNGFTVTASHSFEVVAPARELDLLQRFQATLQFGVPGTGMTAHAVPLGDESGYFWFFDRANAEVTLKILDGRPVNGHFWVFAASMTDVPFTLTITDLEDPACLNGHCPTQTYTNPGGRNSNFIDINAF